MKAISTVIASVLILFIVGGLAGTSYIFISGVFSGTTSQAFELVYAEEGVITIRNIGTETISSLNLKVNNIDMVYSFSPIKPGEIGTIRILSDLPQRQITVNIQTASTRIKGPMQISKPITIPIPVLVLRYFPDQNNDGKLDPEITGMNDDLNSIRTKVDTLTNDGINSLNKGSIYHGYKDPLATPYLNYHIINEKEYLTKIPLSANLAWGQSGIYRPDYYNILNATNICDYVDRQGVREVWMWGYHFGDTELDESNMAIGTNSRTHWNQVTYGDVSNSQQINDMPTCKNSYTLYNYNYGRGLGELLENHGHQIESIFWFVDYSMWNKFRSPNGLLPPGINHCGWTHSPPNAGDWFGDRGQYDWNDETDVLSDCEDWKPDANGSVKTVDCHTWYGATCLDDTGAGFKVWWMQNIPGRANGIIYNGKELRNWWEFFADFDAAIKFGRRLTY